MTETEIRQMRQRINEGIRLTRIRLLAKAKRENRQLIIARNGQVASVAARDIEGD